MSKTTEFLNFIPGQPRAGIRVLVTTTDDLALQAQSLADVTHECQHIVTELLATMIGNTTDTGMSLEVYGQRGTEIVRHVFQVREPQLMVSLSVVFSTEESENKEHLTLKFDCGLTMALVATLHGNDAARVQVH